MPVHQDVHIVCNGIFNTLAQNFQILFAIALYIILGIHGKANKVRIPLCAELFEQSVVHELRKPCETVGACALENDDIPMLVVKLRTHDMKFTVRRWTRNRSRHRK